MKHFARNALLAVATKPTVEYAPITPEQNAWWIDVMGQQGLVEGDLDVNAMVGT